jgi:hypothetical protein
MLKIIKFKQWKMQSYYYWNEMDMMRSMKITSHQRILLLSKYNYNIIYNNYINKLIIIITKVVAW